MHIHLKPYFSLPGSNDALTLERIADALIINGDELDLSILPDGAAIEDAHELHPYLRGSIERVDGMAHVTLRLPMHRRSGHVDDPSPIIDPPDGPIAVPDLNGPEPEPEMEEES